MNRISCLLFLSLFASGLSAQIGVAGYYNVNSVTNEERFTDRGAEYVLDNGYEIALNYWFRLPNQRIEFLPTISYASSNYLSEDGTNKQYGFQAKVNIYPFDFNGDCDCPTFGKQGPQLQKGFFLQLAPGYMMSSTEFLIRFGPTNQTTEEFDANFFTFGAALGLDIGLSNFLTVTPTVGYRRGFGGIQDDIVFTDINGTPTGGSGEIRPATLQFGIHFGFRLDADRY